MKPQAYRLAALVALAAAGSVLTAGCTGNTNPSPLQTIPKVIIDHVDNTTTLTLTSLGADVRYANLTLSLSGENLSAPLVFAAHDRWALTGEVNLTSFTLNVSADDGHSFYYYNASIDIEQKAGTPAGERPQWQLFIRETPLGSVQTQAVPFTRLLEEGGP